MKLLDVTHCKIAESNWFLLLLAILIGTVNLMPTILKNSTEILKQIKAKVVLLSSLLSVILENEAQIRKMQIFIQLLEAEKCYNNQFLGSCL